MKTKSLGALFLVLILGAVWVTYGVFTQRFSDYDEVTVQASRIGLQLPQRADVKIRGVIVGEVLDFEPNADGAAITLGLYQDRTTQIPRDVTASILPKTLFGEKFVSLIVPDGGSSAQAIADGDVIERTQLSTEVEQVLSDLYPLLRAVQPADLNTTLNAVATALEGRGEQVGRTLETLDGYLTRFNPELPGLIEDLRLTELGAASYDYLFYSGYVALAYWWARSVAAANASSRPRTLKSSKLETARFYYARILPRTLAHKAAIDSGAASLMAMAAADFDD